VAEEDISRYLYEEKTYEEFEEKAKQNPSTVLPALWACRNKWLQHPEELEARIAKRDKAKAMIKALNRKNDDLTEKTNVLNELLSLYRTTQRAIPSVKQPVTPTPITPSTSSTSTPAPEEYPRTQKTSKIPDPPAFSDKKNQTFDA
jgi:hypothetical protein